MLAPDRPMHSLIFFSKLHLMWNFWGLRVNASWGPGNGMCCGGWLNDVRADEN